MKTKYKTKDTFAARCPQNRSGYVGLLFLFFLIIILLKFYLVVRVVDLAEQDIRKKNNLPEKEMITDKIHEETPE